MIRQPSSSDHTYATPTTGSDDNPGKLEPPRRKHLTKRRKKIPGTPTHKIRRSSSSGIESDYEMPKGHLVNRQRSSDTSGYESAESPAKHHKAPIQRRKTSSKTSHFTMVKPTLDDAQETKEGVKEVKKLASKTRFEALKEKATKLIDPKNHLKEGQTFMLANFSKIKSLSDFFVAVVHDLKIGGYYLASMTVYGGATGVLASCAMATFLTILPVAAPPVVVGLIVGGAILAGLAIGYGAAREGKSLMPTNSHWFDMLGSTNYMRRM